MALRVVFADDNFLVRQGTAALLGESPDVEEYVSRYPQIADFLGQMLPALGLMRDATGADDTSPASPGGALGTLGRIFPSFDLPSQGHVPAPPST